MQLRFVYIGNFGPSHSTENHVAETLRLSGHRVLCLQEDERETWADLGGAVRRYEANVVLWTRTWSLDREMQIAALLSVDRPVVGFHLDRWWGLNREHQIREEPFFTHSDLMITADGGHDELWQKASVRHHWMPPAVFHIEAERARVMQAEEKWRSPLGFVGSWSTYHNEWPWRKRMIDWLFANYPGRFRVWPAGSQPAVRGDALARLYKSVDVLIGDSCLAGGATHYWSDRIPETLGRGGFLVHPNVEGLDSFFTPDEHLATFDLCSFTDLKRTLDYWLDDAQAEQRAKIAQAGYEHVLEHHTYVNRMQQLVELLDTLDMIDG